MRVDPRFQLAKKQVGEVLTHARVCLDQRVWAFFTDQAYTVDPLGKPSETMKATGSFGIGSDPERLLGFLPFLKQKGRTPFIYQA